MLLILIYGVDLDVDITVIVVNRDEALLMNQRYVCLYVPVCV